MPKGEEMSLDFVGRLQDSELASSPGRGGRVRFFFRPPSEVSQAPRTSAAVTRRIDAWIGFMRGKMRTQLTP